MRLTRHLVFTVLFALTISSLIFAQALPAGNGNVDVRTHKFQPKISPADFAGSAAVATKPTGISSSAAAQIRALMLDKKMRTPAQKKISSKVIYTARQVQGKPAAPGVTALATGVDLDDNNNLLVDITAKVNDQLLGQLRAAGAKIVRSYPEYRSVRALVPPAAVERVAGLPGVIFVGPKQEAETTHIKPPAVSETAGAEPVSPDFRLRAERVRGFITSAMAGGKVGTNAVVPPGAGNPASEGDKVHKADVARSTFGISGSGVKIGVLSDGVSNLALSQQLGNLGAVTVLPDQEGAGDEGTAMLEIIHTLAPNAQLYFATAFGGVAGFAQNIHDLRAAGCDIIVDDVFYYIESPFADGQTDAVPSQYNSALILQAVNDVTADGAMYFSSAGNSGNMDWETAGVWEGDFNDGGLESPIEGGTVQVFGSGQQWNTITGGGSYVTLYWSDPLGASSNDYDFFVLDPTGTTVLDGSAEVQDGTQDPVEMLNTATYNVAGNLLVVFKHDGAQSRYIHLNNPRGYLEVATNGQTHGHSQAEEGYGVAAAPAYWGWGPPSYGYPYGSFPDPFTTDNWLEIFSSDGPRRIFFQADGTPYTPGNFSSTGGILRQKPDISAADGVSVTGVGGFTSPFYGTSAAAPHAAAIAGLIKSAAPSLTNAEIRTALTSTALDVMMPDVDPTAGYGIVMAYEAIASLGDPAGAHPDLGAITASDNPGNGNGAIEAGEGASLFVELNNKYAGAAATGVTATLTTSTPGVTVTMPNTVSYADLAVGASTTNESPFTFTLASDFPVCGTPVEFSLQINYAGGSRTVSFSVPTGPPNVVVTGTLGTTPPTATGITTATGTQNGRLVRTGIVSECGVSNSYPGTSGSGTTRVYDSYTFTACRSTCAEFMLTPPSTGTTLPYQLPLGASSNASVFSTTYAGAFDPANVATNYVADAGHSFTPSTYGVSVTAGQQYTVVVNEAYSGGGALGQNYKIQIPGCAVYCSTPNQVPVAQVQNVAVVADGAGTAAASIDDGSYDPDDDPITITQTPAGPYPLGVTHVLLTVVDDKGATAQQSADVTVTVPDLTISGDRGDAFIQGQTGAQYTLSVSNHGTAATSGTVTVVGTLATGLTVTAMEGTGWTCTVATGTCTRSDSLAVDASYPDITVTLNVALTAATDVTNVATVSGGGEYPATNNSTTDHMTLTAAKITISASAATVKRGQSATIPITFTGNVNFPTAATLSCTTTAPLSTCAVNPASLTVGTTAATANVVVTTTGPNSATNRMPFKQNGSGLFYALFALPAMLILTPRSRKRAFRWMVLLVVLASMAALVGCGSDKPTTTPGAYTVQVTATSGTVQANYTVNLTVTK